MAVELVTGHSGTAHVSSADAGMLNLGIVGYSGVFDGLLDECSLTIQDNNTLVLGAGAGLFQGRFFIVSSAETLAVASGQQGKRRNGFVGLRYQMDIDTGVETLVPEVRLGDFYTGSFTPSMYPEDDYWDKDVNHGDADAFMALWCITINGLQIEGVERHDDEGVLIPSVRDLDIAVFGKAEANHVHDASVITSGTLPIARGGTGVTSTSALAAALGVSDLVGKWVHGVLNQSQTPRNVSISNNEIWLVSIGYSSAALLQLVWSVSGTVHVQTLSGTPVSTNGQRWGVVPGSGIFGIYSQSRASAYSALELT